MTLYVDEQSDGQVGSSVARTEGSVGSVGRPDKSSGRVSRAYVWDESDELNNDSQQSGVVSWAWHFE